MVDTVSPPCSVLSFVCKENLTSDLLDIIHNGFSNMQDDLWVMSDLAQRGYRIEPSLVAELRKAYNNQHPEEIDDLEDDEDEAHSPLVRAINRLNNTVSNLGWSAVALLVAIFFLK